MYCGKEGRCILRYDNETGKGDHVHYGEEDERPYQFISLERLIMDFYADIERLSGEIR
ncbi:MAG: toxin-antitoxin system TumE family protein [Gammaproteobacteria bacterium]